MEGCWKVEAEGRPRWGETRRGEGRYRVIPQQVRACRRPLFALIPFKPISRFCGTTQLDFIYFSRSVCPPTGTHAELRSHSRTTRLPEMRLMSNSTTLGGDSIRLRQPAICHPKVGDVPGINACVVVTSTRAILYQYRE